jgi:hypothetical protein
MPLSPVSIVLFEPAASIPEMHAFLNRYLYYIITPPLTTGDEVGISHD